MQVKVWNDNIYPLKQLFKGNSVLIPAKSFIEMEFYEAHEFLGTYHPVDYDADGKQDPKSYKMLRVEREDAVKGIQAKIKKNLCIVCKHESPSPEELKAHITVQHKDHAKLALPDVDDAIAEGEESIKAREEMKAKLKEELRAELLAEMDSKKKENKKKNPVTATETQAA